MIVTPCHRCVPFIFFRKTMKNEPANFWTALGSRSNNVPNFTGELRQPDHPVKEKLWIHFQENLWHKWSKGKQSKMNFGWMCEMENISPHQLGLPGHSQLEKQSWLPGTWVNFNLSRKVPSGTDFSRRANSLQQPQDPQWLNLFRKAPSGTDSSRRASSLQQPQDPQW